MIRQENHYIGFCQRILLVVHITCSDPEFFPGEGGGGFQGIHVFLVILLCKFRKFDFFSTDAFTYGSITIMNIIPG